MIHIYNNIDSAKAKLYEMIQLEEERFRPYYVDNDFFKNKYNMALKLKYFCIKERDVSEWTNYSKEESIRDNDNKILYFLDYKKVFK